VTRRFTTVNALKMRSLLAAIVRAGRESPTGERGVRATKVPV
jgi:hypothetical protein